MKCVRGKCGNKGIRPGQLCTNHYRVEPHGFVNAQAAQERIVALRQAGYAWVTLEKLTGLSGPTLRKAGRGTSAGTITLDTHQRVMAVKVPAGVVCDVGLVDAAGTRRRIQALQVAGWRQQDLAREFGLNQQVVSDLMYRQRVQSRTAAAVAAAFTRLESTLGPSEVLRRRAKSWGWPPALAWDDIDDPTETPKHTVTAAVPFPERYRELRDCGYTFELIAHRFGVQLESLERQLQRHKVPA